MYILIFGSNYISSAILRTILHIPDAKIIIVDRRDPHFILNNDVIQELKKISVDDPDINKNMNYDKSFKLNPLDRLSFLFLNPITDSVKLYEELSKVNIDIVIDTAMMNDPLFSENNYIETTNVNTTYVSSVFSVLKNLNPPLIYINISSGLVYGKQPKSNLPTKEDILPNPAGARAGSLFARETLVHALARANDIPYMTLRLGNPIGYFTPFEDVINQFIIHHLNGTPLEIHGDGTQARDFFNIEDLGKLMYRIVCDIMNFPIPELPHNLKPNRPEEEKKRYVGLEYIDRVKNQVFNIAADKAKGEDPATLLAMDKILTTAFGRLIMPETQGKIIIRSSKIKNLDWRNSFEKGLQIQMNIDKAKDLLDYDPVYVLIPTLKNIVIPYVASEYLNYDDDKLKELQEILKL